MVMMVGMVEGIGEGVLNCNAVSENHYVKVLSPASYYAIPSTVTFLS